MTNDNNADNICPIWFKCSDKMPKENEWVLVNFESRYFKAPEFCVMCITKNYDRLCWKSEDRFFSFSDITHWMPLPKKP
jgi:Protein of unknown function (DUF551)